MEHSRRRVRPRLLLYVLLGLTVSIAFLASMLHATAGHFVPQGADLYLVAQYARAMAEGHPFRYNAGEAPSTGATSLLHTVVLAIVHRAGIQGEGLIAAALGLGAVLFVLSIFEAARLGRLLGSDREGDLAAILVGLGGPVVWAFHTGGDIALFLWLGLWLLRAVVSAWPESGVREWVIPAALLALTRPEGAPIAAALALAWALRSGARPWRKALLAAVPMLVAFLVLLSNRVLTGAWLSTSIADKSLVANYGGAGAIALVSEYLVDVVRGLLLGFYPSQVPVGFSRGWASLYFPPLGLAFVVAASLFVAEERRGALRLWLFVLALLFAFVSPNVFLGVHFNRYILWAFPGLLVLVAAGWGALSRRWGRGAKEEAALFRAGALVFVGLGFLSTTRLAVEYGQLAGGMHLRDGAAARWITHNLPPGVAIANMATSVEYLTGHRNLNLHGVTSPAFFGNRTAEREAGVLEALTRLPVADRPPYLMVSESGRQANASLEQIISGPAVFRTTSLGDEIEIFPTRYDRLSAAESPRSLGALTAVAGRELVDQLNVCDSAAESAHGYSVSTHLGPHRLNGNVVSDTYRDGSASSPTVTDAGRAVLGHEAFNLATRPGRDLVLVLRTAPEVAATVLGASGSTRVPLAFTEAAFVLDVCGQTLGKVSAQPAPGWSEIVVRVPASAIQGSTCRFELRGRYASFRYWAYQ